MTVQVTYPGVYIDEFAPGAPIEGVGTSTAAFIGPSSDGPIVEPTKLTSLEQFFATFGAQPLPGFYLWEAVRGFFQNGGQVCYVVRASTGAYASLKLDNNDSKPFVTVKSRNPGVPVPDIKVEVKSVNLVDAKVLRVSVDYTAVTGPDVTLKNASDAVKIKPGDLVLLEGSTETVRVQRVTGTTVRLANELTKAPTVPGKMRLADVAAGTRIIRIVAKTPPLPSGLLVPGTMLTFEQDPGVPPKLQDTQIVESVQAEPKGDGTNTTYRVTLRQGLKIALNLLDTAKDAEVKSQEFNFIVTQGGGVTNYANLSVEPSHPRYFVDVINSDNGLVRVELIEPPPIAQPPKNLPKVAGPTALAGGAADDLSTLADAHYLAALDTLRAIDDVNLVAIPGITSDAVQQGIIAHCEQAGDRFGVLDSRVSKPLFGADSVELQRKALDSTRGYAALYYPWLRVPRVGPGAPVLVPPSGHICGIIARSDATRGVHKAPANEIVNGALGVERTMSDVDQGQLNIQGINIIRVFQSGGRPVLWGARTTATDRNWQYVNIRRLFLFLEESIQEGISWAVFEPNNTGLWEKLRRTITDFLTRVWRDGALFGETADKAFYVRIDETLNPDSSRALGRLNIEIGVRPSYPAEFIIVRIGIWYGGSNVTEG